MTPDEAIEIVHSKSRGRTRYFGQEPYLDEVLVAEIKHLRAALAKAEVARDALKARAERAEAAWGRCAAECRAWRIYFEPTAKIRISPVDRWEAVKRTNAAVDAAGDLNNRSVT